ncbi:MAG TPA: hypothetical protein VHN77_05670 [Phycisphaerales bacterium]|nr:hypothetical protein [Phycisphaerales bacterium]
MRHVQDSREGERGLRCLGAWCLGVAVVMTLAGCGVEGADQWGAVDWLHQGGADEYAREQSGTDQFLGDVARPNR